MLNRKLYHDINPQKFPSLAALRLRLVCVQETLGALQVGRNVHADAHVITGRNHQDPFSVFENPKLLQSFGLLQPARRQGSESQQKILAIRIEPDVREGPLPMA